MGKLSGALKRLGESISPNIELTKGADGGDVSDDCGGTDGSDISSVRAIGNNSAKFESSKSSATSD
jgi:hypothetical protein